MCEWQNNQQHQYSKKKHGKLSRLDIDCIRRIKGTRLAFDAPRGYKQASQSDYFDEYDRKKNKLSILDEFIHYGNEWLG